MRQANWGLFSQIPEKGWNEVSIDWETRNRVKPIMHTTMLKNCMRKEVIQEANIKY